MLALAQEVGARRFVHVSTAYVAGLHAGVFGEDMLDTGQAFRNTYEQTKWEAEHLVHDSGLDVGDRPAEHRDGGVRHGLDAGLQRPLLAAARLRPRAVRAGAGAPDGRVDVVPVDYVADGIARLIETTETGTFNLVAGPEAATVDQLAELACTHFDRPRPPYVETGTLGDSAADEHGAVYLPYFDMDVVFDDTRTREHLGLRAPILRDYFDTLMDYADAARWGKRGTTRQEARERVAGQRLTPSAIAG